MSLSPSTTENLHAEGLMHVKSAVSQNLHVVSNRGPRNSSWQEASCTTVVIRSFEHYVGDSRFCLVPPQFRGGTSWGIEAYYFSSSINLTRGLAARRMFRVYPWHEST
ncbi:hypothetical protein TNCV_978371 [Trichonephila clavipes]|nr:hypothetical protein TNCV_978371 [Trichonephila clavipes]